MIKQPKHQPQEWEERFDHRFRVTHGVCGCDGHDLDMENPYDIKSFISQEREKAERIGFDRAMRSVPNPSYSEEELQREREKAFEEGRKMGKQMQGGGGEGDGVCQGAGACPNCPLHNKPTLPEEIEEKFVELENLFDEMLKTLRYLKARE